ncbi:MAG: NADPH:quinone oxidoreductase family protein [Acidobacteriota bacterium]
MKAVVCPEYGSLENLEWREVDEPEPGKGEVLVDVRAAGVNFPDLLLVRGQYQARPDTPFVPGGEAAGVVAAVGPGVERVRVGDRVIAMGLVGAWAERWVVPAAATLPIPDGVSFDVAAGVAIVYGTSYYALKQRAALREGEKLLVLGAAGGVGLATVELGKALGAKVIAAASSPEKLDAAEAAGADLRVDYSTESLKDRVKELTAGRGVDVIYDPVGGDLTEAALRAIAWNGRHLVIGFATGEIPKLPANLALLKGCSIVGVFWGTWTRKDPAGSTENFRQIAHWLADGTLRPRVTPYPAADFTDALAEIDERRVIGKVVLRFADSA